jgi:hypothetical protein
MKPTLDKPLFINLKEFGHLRSANRYIERVEAKVKERFGPKADFAINQIEESVQVELIIPFTDNEINLIGIG